MSEISIDSAVQITIESASGKPASFNQTEPMRARLEPVFLDGFQQGRRFALWILPPTGMTARGSLLCVQPFAEEANRSRRVLVAQACRLALSGWTTLLLDPYGTGDSDGASADATLALWRSDLLRASHLVRERSAGPFVLWGVRAGALLATELSLAMDQLVAGILLWQPPVTGAEIVDPLLERSDAESAEKGETHLNLAGHCLRRDLVDELRGLTMQPAMQGEHSAPCPVLVLGIRRIHESGAPSPKPLALITEHWLEAGFLAGLRVVQAEPFWFSLKPSTPLAVFDATETFLESVDAQA